jgi:hypothetical protein
MLPRRVRRSSRSALAYSPAEKVFGYTWVVILGKGGREPEALEFVSRTEAGKTHKFVG